jgi:hypothetical protein
LKKSLARAFSSSTGKTEMQSFWYECETGRMHAHPLAGVTEILRRDGTATAPGEMGEVVLTGPGQPRHAACAVSDFRYGASFDFARAGGAADFRGRRGHNSH